MNKTFLAVLLAFMTTMSIYAQQITVHGTVMSKTDDEPLIGASVISEATKQGVSTDFDDNFTIKVDKGTKLSVSYVGFLPKTVEVTSDELTIYLEENS